MKKENDGNKNTDDGYSSIDPRDENFSPGITVLIDERMIGDINDVKTTYNKHSLSDIRNNKNIIKNTVLSDPKENCETGRSDALTLTNASETDRSKQSTISNDFNDRSDQGSSQGTTTEVELREEHHYDPSYNETELKYKYIEPPVTPTPIIIENMEEATKLKHNENVLIIEQNGEERRGSLPCIDQTLCATWCVSVESFHSDTSDVEPFVNDADEVELLELVDEDLEKQIKEEERRGKSMENIKQKRLSQLIEEEGDNEEPITVEVEVTDGRRHSKFQALANMFS